MIAVSDAWKAAHNELLLPETFIKLSYSVTEPGLADDATAAGANEEAFSETAEITNGRTKNPERYVSLERNVWGLDGAIQCLDGMPEDPGYTASVLSGETADYAVLPTITVVFSEVHTSLIPGITITWSTAMNEWATAFRVTAYNGSAEVAQKTVAGNTSVVSQVWVDLQNYDKIVIEILGWSHSYRRCRVEELFLGIVEVYTKNNLLGYDHTESVDVLSAALPKSEITFRLDNSTDLWNPNNPTGAERYLLEQQKIEALYGMRVGGTIEWIQAGTFWLSEWNTPSNGLEVSFTARDAITFMNDVYSGPRSGTLLAIATAALEQANLPVMQDGSARFVLDAALASQTTDFAENDTDYTIAEVLQMVAHMACCVLYQDRNGVIHLEPRSTTLSDYSIRQKISYSHPEFEISKPLKAVQVSYGESESYLLPVASSGEVQTVDNVFVKTSSAAQQIAEATAAVLRGRKSISGDFRADPRLDALDIVTVESKYAENAVVISDIKYSTTGGSLRGTYTGRVVG